MSKDAIKELIRYIESRIEILQQQKKTAIEALAGTVPMMGLIVAELDIEVRFGSRITELFLLLEVIKELEKKTE